MTLVYAKIINMCRAGPGTGGWGKGLGSRGGQGGGLKLFTSDCGRHIAVGRHGGCGGEAMMGVRRVVGKRGGERLQSKFWTKQVSLHWVWLSACTLRDKIGRKSRFRGGFPIFGRESPCYDIIISQKRHVLAPKKSKNEMCERFHLIIYARRSSHLAKLKIGSLQVFQTQIFH